MEERQDMRRKLRQDTHTGGWKRDKTCSSGTGQVEDRHNVPEALEAREQQSSSSRRNSGPGSQRGRPMLHTAHHTPVTRKHTPVVSYVWI
ncbi:hypothetical protein Pmani_025622 [Petrolisthes manimaculis]|uniref:Uncharacterized protein n=1 Tax=Petrolisthes manimaculis TaxID=1843537 RepID=A0AAE1P5T2_9EUCA|nr:hypothetical protein Pmani_025622 [Petrolisthes manimaculis]